MYLNTVISPIKCIIQRCVVPFCYNITSCLAQNVGKGVNILHQDFCCHL